LPVGLGVVLVAVVLPCVDFVGEDLLVGDAAIQTLRGEHQHDLRRVGKMHVRQIPEHMGIIDGSMAVGHFRKPPPFQRREQHEQTPFRSYS
jgi:hypothetical protein